MYSEIFRLRDCGILIIKAIKTDEKSLSDSLKGLGMQMTNIDLEVIDTNLAGNIITSILWKDLAYEKQLMPLKIARSLAQKILTDFSNNECTFYTNGNWVKGEQGTYFLQSWNPMTDSTFDSGVIIKHPSYCCCIWVQDEE